jgi:hypothetical protein
MRKAGRNLELVWLGSLYGMDYWAIIKGSKHADLAKRFIAFAQADAQVDYVRNIPYGPTNKQAAERLPQDVAHWVPTAPANLPWAWRRTMSSGPITARTGRALQRLGRPISWLLAAGRAIACQGRLRRRMHELDAGVAVPCHLLREEWRLREELAACYRLIAHFRMRI